MRILDLAGTNAWTLRRRFVGLALLIVLATAAVVAAVGISTRAQGTVHSTVQEGAVNRSITVDHVDGSPEARPLTTNAIRDIAAVPGVSGVEPATQASFGYKDATVPGVLLYAHIVRPSLMPPIERATRPTLLPLADDEIILPRSAGGADLSTLLGRTIQVDLTRSTGQGTGTGAQSTVTVVALSDPSWQIDGPAAAYGPEPLVTSWAAMRAGVTTALFRESLGYDTLTVVTNSSAVVPQVLDTLQHQGFSAYSMQQQFQALPGVLQLVRYASWLLLGCLGAVGFLGALSLTAALARQRTREVGILRAVGFRHVDVLGVLLAETLVVTVAAATLGTVMGLGLELMVRSALRHSAALSPYLDGPGSTLSPALALLPTFAVLVCLAGAFLPATRAARMSPGDAMKDW